MLFISDHYAVRSNQLDQAALRMGVNPTNKTASIKRFSKRVTAVELNNIFARQGSADSAIEVPQPVVPPASDVILSRARSHPNLAPEPDIYTNIPSSEAVYTNHIETSVPNGLVRGYTSVADVHHSKTNEEVVYAVPNKETSTQPNYVDTDSGHNSGNSDDSRQYQIAPHPNYPAPTPPKFSSDISPAPPPPPRTDSSAEVVCITSTPTYANISAQIAQQRAKSSPYESSFRPGTNARLSKDPLATPATQSLRRQSNPTQKISVADAVNIFEQPSSADTSMNTTINTTITSTPRTVSEQDDQVYENAVNFVQSHPTADVILTATESPPVSETPSSFGNAIRQAALAREQRGQTPPKSQGIQEKKEPDARDILLSAIAKRRDHVDSAQNGPRAEAIERSVQQTTKLQNFRTQNTAVVNTIQNDLRATSTTSLSSASSESSSRSIGEDASGKNYKQMAEKARQQWLQKKSAPSSANSSPQHQTTHHYINNTQPTEHTDIMQAVPNPPSHPPPPPPVSSAVTYAPPPPPLPTQIPAHPTSAPPLPPNHPSSTAGLRTTTHSTSPQSRQPPPEKKSGLADLAQIIAAKAKQRQNNTDPGTLNSNGTSKTPVKTTILGQHLLNKSPHDNQVHHINGATVDYSSTENRDKAQLPLADKMKMFNKQPAKTRKSYYTGSDIPPPMVSSSNGSYSYNNGYNSNTNGHSDTVGWVINSSAQDCELSNKLQHRQQMMMNNGNSNSQLADVIHVQALPPPPFFTNSTNPTMVEDTASLVSSVSTLSTLSSVEQEHHNTPQTIQEETYDDLIVPPPPSYNPDDFLPPPVGFDTSPAHNTSMRSRAILKPVELWTVVDVGTWLESIQLAQYVGLFGLRGIDGPHLARLTADDLTALGIGLMTDRRTIIETMKQLKHT